MRKAGGIIALIAGCLALLILIVELVIILADPALSSTGKSYIAGRVVGMSLLISIIIVLAIRILRTNRRRPGIVMAIVTLFVMLGDSAMYFDVILFFAVLGALMSLKLGRTITPDLPA